MQILINFIIFVITLFIYIHINFHLKTNNDLEILDINEINKEKLEEVCDFKKPLLFKHQLDEFYNNLDINSIISNYSSFDVNIRNIEEYINEDSNMVPLKLSEAKKLFSNNSTSNYISEYNQDFIEETTLIKHFITNDLFIRPYLCSESIHDIIMGSANSYTPLRYELNYRNFIYVINGEIEIMLTIPSNKKYLEIINDYDIFEFRSRYNPFNSENDEQLEKVKFLTVKLKKGDIIFIPFKWFYTIKLLEPDTLIGISKYKVIMNTISILPELFHKFLTSQNIEINFINSIKL